MSESQRRVRMGTVSLFALVMIISLSVMAALSAATAKASEAQTDTQAVFLTDTYANESAAQSAVAVIDAQLAACAQTGEGAAGGASALAERAARAAQDAGYAAAAEGPYVAMDFAAASGRQLHVELEIRADYTYQITQWKAATHWNQADANGNASGL